METALSRRTRLTLIIAALLLHVSLLLFLAGHRFEFISKPALVFFEQEEQDQFQNAWAARKAHASAFGVPVGLEEPTAPQPQPETEKEQTQQEPQEAAEQQMPKPAPVPEPLEQKIVESEQTKLTDIPQKKSEFTALPEQPKKEVQNETQPEEKALHVPQPKPEPLKRAPQPQHNLQRMQRAMLQKKLTLAQLAQGFIEHLKNEGDSNVTTLGDENKLPTDEQMKHERYLERITWSLQKSYKINRHKYPPVRPDQTNMEIYLALNKNGSIHDLRIIASSGIKSLDDFALFVFRDASSEFPPLPAYLTQDPYAFVYVVQFIQGPESGFSMSMH